MRYLIVDLEKLKNSSSIEILNTFKACLSEEESLAKFKEIWEHGWDTYYYEDRSLNPQKWEDLEKTL